MDTLPILPTHLWVLQNGRELPDGAKIRKHKVRQPDGTSEWDKTYEHESSPGVVRSLVLAMKRQRVWDADEVFAQLMAPEHRGGRWLREQDDPRAAFEQMWATAYKLDPKASFEQMVELLVGAVAKTPGIQLVYLRELAARYGWRNRGHLDSLLAGLVAKGELREEKTTGPSGTKVTSRRLWKATTTTAASIARTATVTLSLSLLAVGSTRSAKGQKDPDGDRSYLRLLTDEKAREAGLQLLRARWRRIRPAWWSRRPSPPPPPPPPPPPHPPVTDELRAHCLQGIEGLDLTLLYDPNATTSTPLAGVMVRCVL